MKQQIFNFIIGLISILALIFSLLKITPFTITSETYIGTIVSALSIATTFVIGYQIYNAMEIKSELKQFDEKIQQQNSQYKSIIEKNTELEKTLRVQDSLLQGGFDIINANFELNKENTKAAFYFYHHSLIFYLQSDMNDFQPIFDNLRKNIVSLSIQSFTYGYMTNQDGKLINSDIISEINTYKEIINSDENIIREQPNFVIIQTEYNRVIGHFYKRIDDIIIKPNIQLTELEKDKILNPS